MYLMSCTRPDIAYAVNKLSRCTSNPGAMHWQGIMRVLNTYDSLVTMGCTTQDILLYLKDTVMLIGYLMLKTQNPIVVMSLHLGDAAVSWKSSKQTVITRSTMKSEFIALDKCGEEAEWLHHFLENSPRWPKPVPPICIHSDSQSAIGRAQNSMYNGKSRHIRRRHNTIKQQLSTGVISIDYVKSKE